MERQNGQAPISVFDVLKLGGLGHPSHFLD